MSPQHTGVGIVGIGFGQRVHLPVFQRISGCEVRAICAASEGTAARVADKHGVPKAYGDWQQMIADEAIDAIVVATPPHLNHQVVMAALKAGKHVLCEKPLAISVPEAEEMASAAEQAGVAHMVDFQFAYVPAFSRAKEELSTLGRLRHAVVTWCVEAYVHRQGIQSWQSDLASGGGALNMFVSHVFFYLEWLLGPVGRLWSRLDSRVPSGDAETLCQVSLELASGAPVFVCVSSAAPAGTGHRIEIYGDEGTLILDNATKDYLTAFELAVTMRNAGRRSYGSFPNMPPEIEGDGRIQAVFPLAQRFVRWIRSGEPAEPNFRHGVRVQRLLETTRQASKTGRWMDVEP